MLVAVLLCLACVVTLAFFVAVGYFLVALHAGDAEPDVRFGVALFFLTGAIVLWLVWGYNYDQYAAELDHKAEVKAAAAPAEKAP